jgi:hypothetical protein
MEDRQRWVGGEGGQSTELFWARTELEKIPAGAIAFARWDSGSDEPYQAWCDRRSEIVDAHDDAFVEDRIELP